MTAQRIFNTVADHLLTQNRKALKFTQCVYKAANGNRCAVGCLIKPKYYRKRMEEGFAINGLVQEFTLPKYFNTNKVLLGKLQDIHDDAPPSDWLGRLEYLAIERNLKPSPKMLERQAK